jgi:hypothetical protein
LCENFEIELQITWWDNIMLSFWKITKNATFQNLTINLCNPKYTGKPQTPKKNKKNKEEKEKNEKEKFEKKRKNKKTNTHSIRTQTE